VPRCVDSIELWSVDDTGKVDRVRAFWEIPEEFREHLAANSWVQE
jgi:hypothetical protein